MKDLGASGDSCAEPDAMESPEPIGTAVLAAPSSPQRTSGEQARVLSDFEVLYEENFTVIWRMLQALGVMRASLDDAVQDVFLAAYRQIDGFQARSTVRTWLCAMACHVASNHRRREKRKGGLQPIEQDDCATHDPGPLEQLEQSRAWAIVRAFLDQLDERKRTVYVLSRMEGLTAPEVAQALEIPINTVYSRLHATQADLKHFLASRNLGETSHE